MLRRALLIALAAAALGGCGGGGVDTGELEQRLSDAFYPEAAVDLREPAKFDCDLPEGDGIEDRWSCVARTRVPPKIRPEFAETGGPLPTDRGVVIEMDVWVNDDGYFAGVQTGGDEIGPSDTEEPPEGVFGSLGTDPRP